MDREPAFAQHVEHDRFAAQRFFAFKHSFDINGHFGPDSIALDDAVFLQPMINAMTRDMLLVKLLPLMRLIGSPITTLRQLVRVPSKKPGKLYNSCNPV